ncbi:sensor domain-containing protein [Amycolatopsis samaneae]|uniref:Sensor domain-containing protein n=1 Tax=Amycolatopsis samaneae TaxID=664691 RepID=A0ABW5GDS5_9PSEU
MSEQGYVPGAPAVARRPRRKRPIVIAVVAACLVVAGVTWLVWPSARGPVPGTVQAGVLTLTEASELTGVTLASETGAAEPPPALAADPPNCAVAVGPATQAVYGREWTSFLSRSYQDSETVSQHTVTQVLGVYPDGEKARAVFRVLADGVKSCSSAVRTDGDQDTSSWNYQVTSAAADAMAWSATQESGDGWACHRQARLKGNTVLQVVVCQAGDGRPAAAKIADQVAGRVGA